MHIVSKVGSLVLQKKVQTAITSENYAEKNYTVGGYQIVPKKSVIF
jgi:hypothetical protein